MRGGRGFVPALLLSVALHAIAITGPAWRLPAELGADERPPVEARLVAPVPLPQATPRPPTPRRHRSTAATEVPVSAAAEQVTEPVVSDDLPGEIAAAEPAAAVEATPDAEVAALALAEPAASVADHKRTPAVLLPQSFRLRYRIALGGSGFVIGRAMEEFSRDGQTYRMRSVMETTGLARLFKSIRMVYLSEGEVVPAGLRPRAFSIERDGVTTERADFDWSAMTARLSPSGRHLVLETGAQDLLSMFGQLAASPLGSDHLAIPVVTRKRVEPYQFVVVGNEEVLIGQDKLATVHLHYKDPDGPSTTDVWLAVDRARLPVRIRLIDTKGDAYDQTAEVVEVEEGEVR